MSSFSSGRSGHGLVKASGLKDSGAGLLRDRVGGQPEIVLFHVREAGIRQDALAFRGQVILLAVRAILFVLPEYIVLQQGRPLWRPLRRC
jgi:hypothetical protein